jgi:esterase/lipase superfamily enzyme
MRRPILALALALAAACAPRGEVVLMPQTGGIGMPETIFVGTTRAIDAETGAFGGERQRDGVAYARYTVSIPPQRDLGTITYPDSQSTDPTTDFVTTEALVYDGAPAFRSDLARALAALPQGEREVTVFTHGFNNTFAEGLYRIAQMAHDLELPGVQVHYSWPSRGKPLAYVHDRDSALLARDGLERLLEEVAAAGAERIVIVGHSMGAALSMETLRQLAIRGNTRVTSRISGVILLSPDIDVDVFRAQARAISPLPQPFFIFTSRRDRALALSARLTGQRQERLGNIKDVSRIADLKVTVIDVAAFSVGDGHSNVSNSPALIRLLGRISEVDAAYGRDRTGRTGLLPGVVLTVQNVTQVILSPVSALGGGNGAAGR